MKNAIESITPNQDVTMINNERLMLPNSWQTYIGIMAESTTKKNQRWFSIYVPEFLPTHTGDVQPDYKEEDATIQNVWPGKPVAEEGKMQNRLTGVQDGGPVKVTKTIRADYWGWNPYEDVPTMYRDMQVLVINFANLDRWFWIPLERDRSYKTFEHIRFSANNIALTNKNPYEDDAAKDKTEVYKRNTALYKDPTNENKDKETTYYLEIDTKYHKHVKIHTNHSDGELFDYTFEINAQDHKVEIHDECVDKSQPNNTIIMESKPDENTLGRIKLQNAANCTLLMDGEDMTINVPRNFKFIVGGDVHKTVFGNEMEQTFKDKEGTVYGHEKKEVRLDYEAKYKMNYREGVEMNKEVNVQGQHQERQASRQTFSGVASWMSQGSWSLGTEQLLIKADMTNMQYRIGQIDFTTLFLTAKSAVTIFGAHVLQISSSMLWYIPMHMVLPMIPIVTHTLIF